MYFLCTLWYRNSVVSPSCARTVESSMSSGFAADQRVTGIQLHAGDQVALALVLGHEGPGQVGVC